MDRKPSLEGADVAGVEPALDQGLVGGLLVAPVAGEDHIALGEDLAVVGDRDGDARQRTPDGADPQRVLAVGGDGGAGLGEPVALVDRDADAAEEVPDALAERGPPGHRAAALSAEGVTELAVDQPVEQRVSGAQQQAGPGPVEGGAVGHRGGLGEVEDPPLAALVGLLLGRVVDLLEHPRHRQHEVRLEAGQLRGQARGVGEVADDVAVLLGGDLHDPGEDVGQRQEEQRRVAGLHQRPEDVAGRADLEEQVAVGDLAALGAARGARGVDERGEVVGADAGTARLQVGVGDVPAGLLQRVDGGPGPVARLDLPHVHEVGQRPGDLLEGRAVLVGLDDDAASAGVRQAPLVLRGRGGLVDRQAGAARGPERVVEQRPLVAGPGDDPDAVTRLQARRDEPLGNGDDLVAELPEGDRRPLVADGAAVGDLVRVLVRVGPHRVGESVVVRHLRRRRHAVLLHPEHTLSFSRGPRRPPVGAA